ncbi:AraC family transcriptional regulator [Paenibacillus daejeonensis]|uniref:AraC family transcriptional regulator n=1 Tax=Paenibacillus daejeonensis TaxID=135193 RepID=UPI0003635EC9|nr:AraC family transcriptional regulator [Paenibacillus daejeonensis]
MRLLLPDFQYHVYVKDAFHFQKKHDQYDHWALFIAEEGGFHYRMGEEVEQSASSGDMVLCPPGVVFHRRTEHLTFHMLGFQWVEDRGPSERAHKTGKLRLINQPRLYSTLALLRQAWQHPASEMAAYRNHLLGDLLLAWQVEQQTLRTAPVHSDHPVVREALQLLHAQAEAGIPLRSIAQELGISQVQLTRLFQQQLQVSPSTYAAGLRMDKVRQLLARTTLPLARIAEQCGFTDEHHLSKSFKKSQGMNPSMYRRTHQV